MNVVKLNPLSDPRWAELVNSHPNGGIFHHPAWLSLLRDAYGFAPFAICLQEGRDVIGGIPFVHVKGVFGRNRWAALPFSDHCRPLLEDTDQVGMSLVWEFFQSELRRSLAAVEIRWMMQWSGDTYFEHDFVRHILDLRPGSERIFKSLRDTQVQRKILKSERDGVIVRQCKSAGEFHQFYDLQIRSRRRLGVPAQPKRFIDSLWRGLLETGLGYALLAFKDDTAIAGAVLLRHKDVLTYKYAASDYRYRALRGNDAVLWKAIQLASSEGLSSFDLGRTEKENQGLRRFKRSWGADEEPLSYSYLSVSPRGVRGTVARKLASQIIRRSPLIVCRLTGELFYRHFA